MKKFVTWIATVALGAQMTSVATRTIPNHHYVRGFSETRAS